MKFIVAILFALSGQLAAASVTYDITSYPQVSIGGGVALTTTELTLNLTKVPSPTGRYVQITCDQAWGIASATGGFATKQALTSGQAYVIDVGDTNKTLYVQASSTSGTLRVSVLGADASKN